VTYNVTHEHRLMQLSQLISIYSIFSLSLGRPSSRNNNNNSIDSFNLNSIVSSQQQQRQYCDAYVTHNEHVTSPLATPELSPFDNSYGGHSSNASVSLPSPMAYDGFDDPLSGSRHSFRGSLSDCDGIFPTPFSLADLGSCSEQTFTFSEIQR